MLFNVHLLVYKREKYIIDTETVVYAEQIYSTSKSQKEFCTKSRGENNSSLKVIILGASIRHK